MVEQRVLPPDQIAELVGRLAALRWSWVVNELDRIVGELGWTVAVAPQEESPSTVLGTGLPIDGLAGLVLISAGVGEIVVRISDAIDPSTPEALAANRDAFAISVRVAATAIGEPVDRRPGERPEVRWPASSGLLRITQTEMFVELALMSVSYAELEDARLTEPSDDEFSEEVW